jgi:hypothetical protein
MAITKQNIAIIHKDIREALEAVAKKHNLSLGSSNITYDANGTGFKLKQIEFLSKDVMGDVDPTFFRDMQRNGFSQGLSTDDIGKKVVFGTRTYEIMGMKGRVTVIGKLISGDNKLYKLDPKDVYALLHKVLI